MNLHGSMQHGNDVIIRFPVATTKEDRSEGINIGTKVQWRDNSHVGKKSEKEVKEIWAVCGARVPSRASSCSYVKGSRKLAKKVEAEKYLRVGTTF